MTIVFAYVIVIFERNGEVNLQWYKEANNYDELKYDNSNEYGKCMCMPT